MTTSGTQAYGTLPSDPGIQLADLLRRRLFAGVDGGGVYRTADKFFNADGKLEEAEKERVVGYAIRRIIHGARFKIETANVKNEETSRMLDSIHDYVIKNTSVTLDDPELEKFKLLIFAVIDSSRKSVSQDARQKLLSQAQGQGVSRCYICGVELDFASSNEATSPDIEHVFPHSFGGANRGANLRVACHDCNSQKGAAIGFYDFHFERISTRHEEGHKNWKKRLFSSPNALAILLKEECQCSTCGREAADVGELRAFRFETTDSWHYLNIGMNCNNH